MADKKAPNYYCQRCPHSGALHRGIHGECKGLDAAGDTCDCAPFIPDRTQPPMEEPKKPRKPRIKKDWARKQAEQTLNGVFNNKDAQVRAVAAALRRAHKNGAAFNRSEPDWPSALTDPGLRRDLSRPCPKRCSETVPQN